MKSKIKTVLIVDDDTCIINLVSLHVEMAGYKPITALDGISALQLAYRETPNVIILDLMLPETDGWEVCRSLKQDKRTAAIPVLILSALSDKESKSKAVSAGADEFMAKPFSPKELMAKIMFMMGRKSGSHAEKEGVDVPAT